MWALIKWRCKYYPVIIFSFFSTGPGFYILQTVLISFHVWTIQAGEISAKIAILSIFLPLFIQSVEKICKNYVKIVKVPIFWPFLLLTNPPLYSTQQIIVVKPQNMNIILQGTNFIPSLPYWAFPNNI